jgi:predicted porin
MNQKVWGRVFFGRQDLHYGGRESYLTDKGDLKADSISLLAYAAGGIQAVANATRTPNVIVYDTPNWGGFSVRGAYSFNPHAASEADINSPVRRGYAWNLQPIFSAANWTIGYSYWKSKQDNNTAANGTTLATCFPGGVATPSAACTTGIVGIAAAADQRADRLFGSVMGSGFRCGRAWDKSKLEAGPNTAAGGTVLLAPSGTKISDRQVWSIPLSYTWGNSEVHFHYDQANNDKGQAFSGSDSKAKMWAISYQYSLSKRTSLAVQYAQINNGSAAAYNFFTSAAATIGSPSGAINFGEDPRLFSGTIRHAF